MEGWNTIATTLESRQRHHYSFLDYEPWLLGMNHYVRWIMVTSFAMAYIHDIVLSSGTTPPCWVHPVNGVHHDSFTWTRPQARSSTPLPLGRIRHLLHMDFSSSPDSSLLKHLYRVWQDSPLIKPCYICKQDISAVHIPKLFHSLITYKSIRNMSSPEDSSRRPELPKELKSWSFAPALSPFKDKRPKEFMVSRRKRHMMADIREEDKVTAP